MADAPEGRILSIVAVIECGGCGEKFRVEIDPSWECSNAFDAAIEAVTACNRVEDAGMTCFSSVQGGYMLCPTCTRKCDTDERIPEDRRGTREEVRTVLEID